ALAAVPCADSGAEREACAALAAEFRLRRDLAEHYANHARRAEDELNLAATAFDRRGGAAAGGTVLRLQRQFPESVGAGALAARHTLSSTDEAMSDLVAFARGRQRGFWSEHDPETQPRWALIAVAGEVLIEAERIEKAVAQLSS